ncbi:MAG: 1-acyl-sn-glycerol-3-phosphate acyltransferase [Candidatus Amulumruptor caecigallinarius]|nr:1-acyl-sn-glycerol-3-phosphate acyltransferase [Candidatus Amulumruptor caecigallinarius]MCM1396223.1 1-acyl-sn-glycerol-3-phosphate acyltransferase [Candidatus Amulumruptor caecigallinarius]MCM1453777.1 1-acyl-sn-glycerol-3-phosphate acyltransferase [bacterium]
MNFAAHVLRCFGWSVTVTVPDVPKSIICVAPHTSNWDFIIGKLAYASIGRKAGFLMKDSWFFWPLGPIFRALGGVPVARTNKQGSLVEQLVERFRRTPRLTIAITPEGTRSRTTRWHTGFLRIAMMADVPVYLAVIDYASKCAVIDTQLALTGDIEADMRTVKRFYAPYQGLHPEKFTTEDDPS